MCNFEVMLNVWDVHFESFKNEKYFMIKDRWRDEKNSFFMLSTCFKPTSIFIQNLQTTSNHLKCSQFLNFEMFVIHFLPSIVINGHSCSQHSYKINKSNQNFQLSPQFQPHFNRRETGPCSCAEQIHLRVQG
jgi:hypothetical protein